MSLIDKGFGLTAAGFLRPALSDILTDLQEELDSATGLVWRKDPNAVIGGQVLGVAAKSQDRLWGLLSSLYASFDPRTATGRALEAICAWDLVFRRPARSSTGLVIATGDNGFQIQPGDVVSSSDDQLRYLSADTFTGATATAWASTTAYSLGDVRSHAGNIYYCTVAGTSGGTGPVGATVNGTETDGGVTWLFCGAGLAFVSVNVGSETIGPIGGPSGSLTKIGTPRSGWRGVINPDDVSLGAAQESDEQLRIRRVTAKSGNGRATIDAIRAGILALADAASPTGAFVFENTTNVTDANGVSPHGVEPVITGPAGGAIDAEWAQTLLGLIAAGIQSASGTTQTTVTDSYGITHAVGFTRPAATAIYCKITVTVDQTQWPSDTTGNGGAALAKAAALGYGQAFVAGLNARHSAVEGAVWKAAIPGTLGVSAQLDTVPITSQPPADVAIDLRHIAAFDSSRMDVVVVVDTP